MNSQGTHFVPCFLVIIKREVLSQGVEMKATQVRATPTTPVYKCSVCERPVVAFYARHGYNSGTCSKKCEADYAIQTGPSGRFGPSFPTV
jgi:hypothetical protein